MPMNPDHIRQDRLYANETGTSVYRTTKIDGINVEYTIEQFFNPQYVGKKYKAPIKNFAGIVSRELPK